MINVSGIFTTPPPTYKTELQKMAYAALQALAIPFERVDTGEAITMEDCLAINDKLAMKTVKTLLLCNRQQTAFYLFITTAGKPFITRDFGAALGVARLSFASAELLWQKLGVSVGAATIFGVLQDAANEVKVVIDAAVLEEDWFGCSDGTTTGYMKVSTASITGQFLVYAKHPATVIAI